MRSFSKAFVVKIILLFVVFLFLGITTTFFTSLSPSLKFASLMTLSFLFTLIVMMIVSQQLKNLEKVIKNFSRGDVSHQAISEDFFSETFSKNLIALSSHLHNSSQNLSQNQAHLSTILANMVEAVVAIDLEGKILHLNPTLIKLFGLPSDLAFTGKHYLEVLRHQELDQALQLTLKDFQKRTGEIRISSPSEMIFETHIDPLLENEKHVGVLVVLHDVTTLRRLEHMRKEFVANVSHELRTPLASIKGFAETLMMGGIDDKENRKDFVSSIERQADRMAKLVNDLLDLAAIESGQKKIHRSLFAINDVIEEVFNGLASLAKKKKITLINSLPTKLPAISADRDQIKQVITNLIENAIKYSPEQKSVTAFAEIRQGNIEIFIKDQGIGIAASDLPRLFERFYRVDKARSREMGGTGLGLSIVKHIIESHGGSVHVSSVESQGSTFSFTLPISN